MKNKIKFSVLFILLFFSILVIHAYRPFRNLYTQPKPWPGNCMVRSKLPEFDQAKKTVVIIADPVLTEMFDMLAPFYLFNATQKANVYIVAKHKIPVFIKRDLFIMPQLSFSEADSMNLHADLIVIPALSIRDEHQDSTVIAWIKKHFTSETKMLTICDGASTGAATGFYDGKPITCHASDFDEVRKHFSKSLWVQQVSVAKAGNLFSTAGVSNAVEGSLLVIGELFGSETSKKVAADINYPHEEIRLAHQSIALNSSNKFTVVKKIFFRNNRNIAILLENGINELTMATILDTYSRTMPASFKTYILHDSTIQTKYGLSIIYKGNNEVKGLDELHLAMPESFTSEEAMLFKNIKTVRYDTTQKQYLFNTCLKKIGEQYGYQFEKFVKISLDYN